MVQSFAADYAPTPAPDRRPEAVHLGQIWQALRTRWRLVAGAGLIAFAGSLAFVNTVTPRYTGEAKLILENRDSVYTRPAQDRAEQPVQIDEQAVASQVQVVMSRDLAREAIRQLGLVGNPEFDPLADDIGPVRRLMILVGLAQNPLDRPPEDRVLERYYERLLVYPVGKSRILAIEFRSKDPELAAKAANTIAELYLSGLEAAKKDTARSASTWLGGNIDGLRRRVAEAEAKVETFRAKSGLFQGGNNAPINGQHLSELNTQLVQARTAQADSQAKAQLIRDLIKTGRTFEIPDVANNELIRRLIEQRINLRAQLALELRTLLPGHPRIKELNAQVQDLENQIRGAAERTVRTLENDAKIAGSRVETLQAAIDAQKKVVVQANEAEVQLRALEREARAEREQLESYLARYREATARDVENAVPADARIVSRAIVPERPSFPKKLPIIIFTTLAAMVLAAGAVVAREMLATPVPGAEPVREGDKTAYADAEAAATAPFSARGEAEPAPEADAEPDLARPFDHPAVASEEPAQLLLPMPLLEAPRQRFELGALIARLSADEPEGGGRRVLVTGLEGSSGAADLARELGRTLSRDSRAILIAVDGGGVPAAHHGFTDLIAGEMSFTETIQREPESRLHLVEAGFLDGSLSREEWRAIDMVLSAFEQTYDWVICVLHDSANDELFKILAPRVHSVVIASNEDAASVPLVSFYERAKGAGAPDVVVARELAPEEEREGELAAA